MNGPGLNSKKSDRLYIISLVFAIGLFLFTHLYKLDSILDMWNTDEVGLILNVQSLAKYGTDRYGNSFPMYPINYIGEQSPLFTYLYLIVYKLFGYSRFSIRMLTVVFSMIATFYWGRIYYLLGTNKRKNTLMMVFAMAGFPTIVLLMRLGLDCNLMFTLTPIFFFYLLKAVYSGTNKDYVIAGIAAGIILYSYILSHLTLPFFLLFVFVYLIRIRKIHKSNIIAFMIPVILLAIPLIPFHIVNTFRLEPFSVFGISYVSTPDNRTSEISALQIPSQLLINSIPLLFFDAQPYSTISYLGTIHWISLPFFILGLIRGTKKTVNCFKKKEFNMTSLVTIWFYAVYLSNSMILGKAYRFNPIFFSVIYLTIEGINEFLDQISDKKRKAASVAIGICYAVSIMGFAIFYLGGYYTHNYLPQSVDEYCAYDMTNALIRAEELRTEIGDRDLYIGNFCSVHAHYQLALDIDSKDFYLDKNGQVRADYESVYGNNYFYLVSDPWDSDIYMVNEGNTDYCQMLTDRGFTNEYVDHYYIFYKTDL